MRSFPKLIAFYLPQFHQIPENDEWWGEGFTDWVAVKKANPMFLGHYQPRIPFKEYYYDLLDKKTMEWQAKLAKKAGIYGFCIYHYWFGEKQLLEKPAENLLKWTDIDINYCFSWANESWIASWSKLAGNAWFGMPENKKGKRDYLIQQKYGYEKEWRRHFEYLLPFFKDRRYIRKNNRPVFIIYKPNDIKQLRLMMKCWNDLAKENGLDGICFIGTNDNKWKRKGLDGMLLYEPTYTFCYEDTVLFNKGFYFPKIRERLKDYGINYPNYAKYSVVWNKILSRPSRKNIFPGLFVDFDSTPRKGKNGTVFVGVRLKKFERYLKRFLEKFAGQEFIFITAWNEWGEGAYLEPDQKNGNGYLEVIRRCLRNMKQV